MNRFLVALAPFLALVAVGCGRERDLEHRVRNYEVIEEGSASGVATSLGGEQPGSPTLTATNVDTTTDLTLIPGQDAPVTAGTAPDSLAETLEIQPGAQPRGSMPRGAGARPQTQGATAPSPVTEAPSPRRPTPARRTQEPPPPTPDEPPPPEQTPPPAEQTPPPASTAPTTTSPPPEEEPPPTNTAPPPTNTASPPGNGASLRA